MREIEERLDKASMMCYIVVVMISSLTNKVITCQ